jgi:hypothetical protein
MHSNVKDTYLQYDPAGHQLCGWMVVGGPIPGTLLLVPYIILSPEQMCSLGSTTYGRFAASAHRDWMGGSVTNQNRNRTLQTTSLCGLWYFLCPVTLVNMSH